MGQSGSWVEQLETALEVHREYLEGKRLARLMELFALYKTYFENVYNILLRKALIEEDPYKYDEKIAQITTPPTTQFFESEKQEQMSQRLSQFHSQLEFLISYATTGKRKDVGRRHGQERPRQAGAG